MIRLAIIGTGNIAANHAVSFSHIKGCKVVAGCDVVAGRAAAFCAKHSIPKSYTDPAMILADPSIDAIVNSTPDRFHAPLSLAAIKAGKHVLCEKPLALNYCQAHEMVRAAKKRGVINMVNFAYRNAPAVQKAHQIAASGRLGDIVHLDACYLQSWLVSDAFGPWRTTSSLTWKLSTRHGSQGVLGDIGIHIIDLSLFIAGGFRTVNTQLKTFSEQKGKVHGQFTLDANDTALVQVELENGALGMVHTTRWGTGHLNKVSVLVCGTRGALRYEFDTPNKLHISLGKDIHAGAWKQIDCQATPTIAQLFIKSIRTGVNAEPSFERGAQAQKVIDACFTSAAQKRRIRV